MEELCLAIQKENNIVLDQALAKVNEQERNKQNLELALQNVRHKQIENYLIQRNEIKKEKQREIKKEIEIKNELSINILQKENEHELQLQEMKNKNDIQKEKMESEHKIKMKELDLENSRNEIESKKSLTK